MRVTVLFFGALKEITGCSEDVIELAAGASAAAVFEHYASAFPKLREWERSILMARNQQFAARSQAIADGDEIALLPPVSGGASRYTRETVQEPAGHFFALTREPIDTRALAGRMLRGEDGAVVAFEGTVRNNTKGRRTLYLDYEGYEPMALQVMAALGCELAAQFAIGMIAMVHRLGRMEIGETSVAVVVTAPHRKPAFDAALEAINRLKRSVPIWKKEYFADGEVWVEGEWDESLAGR
ncbi:MAG TPA: molybdenum cofactor biosynthesis protein MoaE [Bryobacteraceae bacterium]